MDNLTMELRDVRESERVVVGVVVPYDETSYLVPDPGGERILRTAFAKSIRQRGDRIPLLRNHDRSVKVGTSRGFTDDGAGLIGEFVINPGEVGDGILTDCRDGYYGAMSAGFATLNARRGVDGAREVSEAMLVEVSLVAVPAYQGAGLLAVRNAQDVDAMLAPFLARPDVNLDPLPPFVYRPR